MTEKLKFWVREQRYVLGAVLLVLAFFCALEVTRPYYFLQDDNRNAFLPAFIFAFKSVFSGHIPYVNFHQFGGVPFLATGFWAALYPFSYLATFLSLFITGNYFAAIDAYVILHLLIGTAGMFLFLQRTCRLPSYACFFGATAWPVTGFAIFLGSSWILTIPAAAWFPWMLWAASRIVNEPVYGNMVWSVAFKTLLALTGSVQYMVLGFIAEIVFTFSYIMRREVRSDRARFSKAVKLYLMSFGFTALLSAPVLLPMAKYAGISADRAKPLTYSEFSSWRNNVLFWFWGMVFPFSSEPLKTGSLAKLAKMFSSELNYFSFFVPYFCFLGYGVLAGLLGLLRDIKRTRHELWLAPVLVSAGVVLLWSFGAFDRLVYQIPVLNRFRYDFKIMLFANAFLVAAASLGIVHLARRIAYRLGSVDMKRIVVYSAVFNVAFSFIIYAGLPSRNFLVHEEPVPLTEPLQDKLVDGRIASFANPQSLRNGYMQHTLAFNFATMWDLYNVAGYQTLAPGFVRFSPFLNQNGFVSLSGGDADREVDYALKFQGARWYVVNRADVGLFGRFLNDSGAKEYYSDENRVILEVPNAIPMVSAAADGVNSVALDKRMLGIDRVVPLKADFFSDGITVVTEFAQPVDVLFGVSPSPYYSGAVDGKAVPFAAGKTPIPVLSVPAGKHVVSLKFHDKWFVRGIFAAFGGLLLMLAVIFFWRLSSPIKATLKWRPAFRKPQPQGGRRPFFRNKYGRRKRPNNFKSA